MSAAEADVACPEPSPAGDGETTSAAQSPSWRLPAWLPIVALFVLGALVFLPAIRAPHFLDDYFQTSMVEGTYPTPRSPFDLYNFVGDQDRAVLLDRGLLPWWSHPRITVRFLRPLSSLLLFADHRVLGNRPLLSHLHSFAWWGAAALAARALYRRTLGRRAAMLAMFVFALAPCHAFPLVWLANREVLVSVTFGILAITSLVRLRQGASSWHAASATVFFALSVLGGEYALSFGGYALALALVGGRSKLRARILGLFSFAAPAALYLIARAKLGYGTEGSGFYHDPFRDPAAFFERVPRRLATLLAEGWLTLDPDMVDQGTSPWALGAIVALGILIVFVPLRRAFKELPGERREHATWLLVGSLLALGPVLAVMPAPRVLAASAVGVAATIGVLLERAWFPAAPEPRTGMSELSGLLALGLGFAHLIHGPGAAWLTCRVCSAEAVAFVEHAAGLRERVPDPARTEVVLVRGLGGSMFVLPYALDDRGTPPARFRILALAGHVLVLRRDERTIDVVAARGKSLFPSGEGDLFRGEIAPLAPGDVVRVPGMLATVLEVGEAGPYRVRFEWDDPLETSSSTRARVWVADRFDGIQTATLPEVGFGQPFDPFPPATPEDKQAP